ncbi:hypothetical protein DL89DRAFT_265517 [Linderina pennispora]|uniref:RING-type domain-containing protein n=1 Tax=Linderina pennispora TaxID=61395 RepID=A0A1Y1WE51_9FUNG|nr:uncharacterized protein DL89DRAFT_265517 [Linderina pennispora]ORX71800.1 hypothetical protein DL89DRAFT_265517 [Linderina pennispora]
MNGQVVLLPCNHAFHKMCARGWLLEQSEECPLCKRSVRVALGILEAPEELAPVECEIGARRVESSV